MKTDMDKKNMTELNVDEMEKINGSADIKNILFQIKDFLFSGNNHKSKQKQKARETHKG